MKRGIRTTIVVAAVWALIGMVVVYGSTTVNTSGRPNLIGTITADGTNVYFNITAVGQANDGDPNNPSKYYSQTNFDNEYFTVTANNKLVKYNMFNGNTTPYWGTGTWSASAPLPAGVTFSQTQMGDDFVYSVSMSYTALGVAAGDTFWVQIKARDFNDDYVQSYSGYTGFDGLYSQYRGLYITDTGTFNVTLPPAPPDPPTGLDLAAADDTGYSDTDNITKNTTGLSISGSAEPNSIVKIKEGTTVLGTGPADSSGDFGIDIDLPEGTHSITATATNTAGESTPSTVLSIVVDTTAPMAICKDITVNLDISGNASIVAADVDNGSWDNYGIASMSVLPNSFGRSDVGANTVTLTVTDYSGNSGSATATVTVNYLVRVELKNHTGGPLNGGVVEYADGSWKSFGTTGNSGSGYVDKTFPAGTTNLKVRLSYAGGSQTITQDISGDPIITFQTVGVQARLQDSGGNGISGGSASYAHGSWIGLGTTDASGNTPGKELLPGDYKIRMSYKGKTETHDPVHVALGVTKQHTEVFQTTTTCLNFSGTIKYSAGSWWTFPSNSCVELLPGSYNFYFDGRKKPIDVSGNKVEKTIVILRLRDHNWAPLSGGTARGGVGSSYWTWHVFGKTDSSGELIDISDGLNPTMSYEMKYNSTTQAKTQNVATNSYIDFQTVQTTVKLIDHNGNGLSGGAVAFGPHTGNEGWFPGTPTNGSGEAKAELFPGTYMFRMQYNGTEYKKGTVASAPPTQTVVTFQTGQLHWDGKPCLEPYRIRIGSWRFFTKPDMELLPGTYEIDFAGSTPSVNQSYGVTAGAITTISDIEDPKITCPGNITVNNDLGQCGAVVMYTVPAGTDNCPGATTIQKAGLGSGAFFLVGTTTEIYEVTDAAGNKASCSFTVTVTDTENPTITCPTDVSVSTDAGLCTATGVALGTPTTADNCSVASVTNDHSEPYALGDTIVTWTVTDGSGNTASCTQKVTVVDTENPVISGCPANITQDNDPGVCNAVVTWTPPTASDNCDPSPGLTSTRSSGDTFPVGTTTVTYTATDACGNTSTCIFNVTVNDVEPPTTVFTSTPPNPDNNPDPYFEWTGTDNNGCTSTSNLAYQARLDGAAWPVVWSPATFTTLGPLAEGTHTFEVRAMDEAGNIGDPVIYTWLVDLSGPEITITVPEDDGEYVLNDTVYSDWVVIDPLSGIDTATAADDVSTGMTSGEPFYTGAPGLHNFTVTATDLAGNTTTETITYRVVYTVHPGGAAGGGGGAEGEGGTFLDKSIAGGGGAVGITTLEAVYTVGDIIHASFSLTDADGEIITDAVVSCTLVKVTLGEEEAYEILNLWKFIYDSEIDLYLLDIETEGLYPGVYDLWLGFDDGTQERLRIQLEEGEG